MPINDKQLNFAPSPSSDVERYRIYWVLTGETINAVGTDGKFTAQHKDLGLNTSVLLSDVVGLVEGSYDLGVTAIDDVGNESSMSIINGLEVDFVAPDPPGAITVTQL